MADDDRSQRYRARQVANGLTKVCVWVPVGAEEKLREFARAQRGKMAARASGPGVDRAIASGDKSAIMAAAFTLTARAEGEVPPSMIRTWVRVLCDGKAGPDLYKAKKAFRDACRNAGVQVPSDRQIDLWLAEAPQTPAADARP